MFLQWLMVAGDLDSGEDEPWMGRATELLRLGDRRLECFKAGAVEGGEATPLFR